MNATNFKGHLLVIADATNKDLSEALVRLWWDKYGTLPDDILLAAFGQVIDSCKFFPSPAEFNDILAGVRRAAGVDDPRPEDQAAILMQKISRYNPDLGVVNDGTRGLLYGGQARAEDNPNSGFTPKERQILRLFGGAARMVGWDTKDVQFNRSRMIEAFKTLAEEYRDAEQYAQISAGAAGWLGQGLRDVPKPARPRLVSGDE